MSAETDPTAGERLYCPQHWGHFCDHPATPDASEGLTEAEREALQDALSEDVNDAAQNEGPMPTWWAWFITHKGSKQHTTTTVERIVAARVAAAVEQERAARLALVARVEALAADLCDFHGGHGDYLAAGKALRALLTADDTSERGAS